MNSKRSGGRDRAAVGGEIRQTSGELIDSRYEKLAMIGSGRVLTREEAQSAVPLRPSAGLMEDTPNLAIGRSESNHLPETGLPFAQKTGRPARLPSSSTTFQVARSRTRSFPW